MPAVAGGVQKEESEYLMASKKQERKTKPEEKKSEETSPKDLQAKGEDLKNKMDELIDDIDGVLEENAEEFVANYVQRGGE